MGRINNQSNQSIVVNEFFFNYLNEKFCRIINLISSKKRLDDTDIEALKEILLLYDFANSNRIKKLNLDKRMIGGI